MKEIERKDVTGLERSEVGPLAAKLAREVEGFAKFYEEAYKLSREEAMERARSHLDRDRAMALEGPVDQVSWISLGRLAEDDPRAYEEAWRRLKVQAMMELQSGFRAADALSEGFDFGPYERARFLAARHAFRREWNPSPGAESTLCDMLAQIQAGWEAWLGRHMMQLSIGTTSDATLRRAQNADVRGYIPPRLTEAQALEESAMMMERFQRMFLRAVRTLRELKRNALNVVVHQANQVNMAEQQVNVSDSQRLDQN